MDRKGSGKRKGEGGERGRRGGEGGQGWEGKFSGPGGREVSEGKGVGKRGGKGKFRGPGPQMVFFLEPRLPQRYLYTVHEESGIPSTRTTCKKSETGRGIGGAL